MIKATYGITGMSCNGCRSHVQQALSEVGGVTEAVVNLEAAEAQIQMDSEIDLAQFQKALDAHGGRYKILLPGSDSRDAIENTQESITQGQGTGVFYCPMRCEGEQVYSRVGDCPVCGMDLVEEMSFERPEPASYTCSIHPEVMREYPGLCPICNKDLVQVPKALTAEQKTYRKLVFKFKVAIGFTVPVFLIAMSEMLPFSGILDRYPSQFWGWLQFVLSLPVVFYSTRMFFERAYRSIRYWNLNMFTLIGIGAGISWLFSVLALVFPEFFPQQFKSESGQVDLYFEATTVILTLVLMGQVLEAKAHGKTNAAIRELLHLAPNTAIRIKDGVESEVPVSEIKVGDILRVLPGGKIPVDGIIISGSSSIDESMISGEAMPVDKLVGDALFSGTMNGNTSFLMQAEKVGSHTMLAQIVKLVNEASRSRAPIQNLADRISAYFVPVVVLTAIITCFVWSVWGPEPALVYGLVNGIAVLIIACPCALGLATPMSVMVGIGKGARHGVLIREAAVLEHLSKVRVMLVDKTGTLTQGRPAVEHVHIFEGFDRNLIIKYLGSVNQFSEHLLGQAIVKYAIENKAPLAQVMDFKAEPGRGVYGKVDTHAVLAGNLSLMQEYNIVVTEEAQNEIISYQEQGKTVSWIAIDGIVAGFVVLGDPIKPGASEAIQELKQLGLAVIMLTGDNEKTAAAVAADLQLSAYRAGLLPQQKLDEVHRLKRSGQLVAMAGDGINDAPALAASDVGIAMDTGTDVAISNAAITLVNGDLQGLVRARKLSTAVMNNIRQNLFFALLYNSLGVPVAAGLLYPFFGVLLSPMLAAAAMSFSSVSVITNALRLRTISLNS